MPYVTAVLFLCLHLGKHTRSIVEEKASGLRNDWVLLLMFPFWYVWDLTLISGSGVRAGGHQNLPINSTS
jgi:hypothetical protein